MTYISAQVSENKKNVIVWHRTETGERDFRVFRAPYYFYYPDEDGKHLNIYDKKLSKIEFNTYNEFYQAKEEFKNSGIEIYESDIGPEYKILSEHYYNKPVGKLNTTFLDIEVTKDPAIGYATINNPYAPICSVALYHKYNDRMVVYAVPPDDSWTEDKLPEDLHKLSEIVLVKDERMLLKCLLAELENTDVMSGWNSDWFDIPYIYFRIKHVLGEEYLRQMGFDNSKPPRVKEVEKFKVMHKTIQVYGRVSLDYMEVFKKLEQENRPSYSLEAIADELLPDLPKLSYDGALDKLYSEDFAYFLRYNIRDTEILKGLEEKLKYAEFTVNFSHLATGLCENVLTTIRLTELAIINYCHNVLNRIVPDVKKDVMADGKYMGALVLNPQVGMHEYASAVDIVSLYPSTMRTLNISPETIVGQFLEKYKAYEDFISNSSRPLTLLYENGFTETYTSVEWKEKFEEEGWCISGYGTVYNLTKQGFIPAILTEWFEKRKEYKKMMKDLVKKASGLDKSSVEYNELQREIDYYDKMQYVMKIRLNSIYGACGNPYFRFYDVRNAESTTRSGQAVLMHMVRSIAHMLDGEYLFPSESVIYGDTDSCYFKTHASSLPEAITIADTITKNVNAGFPKFITDSFMCHSDYNNFIKAEYEFISSRSIFVAKKLYLLHLVYKEGKETDKMKIMGLQIKKTTIPKPIRKKLAALMEQLLKGKSWIEIGKEIVEYKDKLMNMDDILKIGLPKGIKKIEEYTELFNADPTTNLPGHIAAAMFWNKCLDVYDDKDSVKITSGSKLKVFYLTKSFGRFKSIAVPTDTKKLPAWFVQHYLGLIDKSMQVNRLVDKPLKNIIKAIGQVIPTKKLLFVEELLEY